MGVAHVDFHIITIVFVCNEEHTRSAGKLQEPGGENCGPNSISSGIALEKIVAAINKAAIHELRLFGELVFGGRFLIKNVQDRMSLA